ncbi:MAG TPA: ribosome silencing factor [Desulfobacterales bacterium]|jgi:ribosome-associated protein|nr:ribosome silencing factor [Desulfobacterales bacterium]
MTDDINAGLEPYIKAVLGKKPVDVVALDMRELTSIADAFIICSGRSNRQVTAIAEHVERQLRKQKVKPLGVEGATEGQWVLMDYGHVIIHVFYDSVRQFYDLEGLWTDARRIELPSVKKRKAAARRAPSRVADA